jgi:hypothetical protein
MALYSQGPTRNELACPKCRVEIPVNYKYTWCASCCGMLTLPVLEQLPNLVTVLLSNGDKMYRSQTYSAKVVERRDWQRESRAQLIWPGMCVCCLGGAETSRSASTSTLIGVSGPKMRYEVQSWQVPYCQRCNMHCRLYDYSPTIFNFLAGVAGIVLAVAIWTGPIMFISVVSAIFVAALGTAIFWRTYNRNRVRKSVTNACTCLDKAVEYMGGGILTNGVHTFTFTNQRYCDVFMNVNGSNRPQKSSYRD